MCCGGRYPGMCGGVGEVGACEYKHPYHSAHWSEETLLGLVLAFCLAEGTLCCSAAVLSPPGCLGLMTASHVLGVLELETSAVMLALCMVPGLTLMTRLYA